MTEAQWLACTVPRRMLEYVPYRVSKRKWRLMAVAFARRIWDLLTDDRSRTAVEVAERWADGQATITELNRAMQSALPYTGRDFPNNSYAAAAAAAAAEKGKTGTERAASLAAHSVEQLGGSRESEEGHQCHLIRDVLGYPYRTARVGPALLTWNEGTIPRMAKAIYEERAFERLPILADALEEAGCTDDAILEHLRGPGPHVRGCWALDLILGRE